VPNRERGGIVTASSPDSDGILPTPLDMKAKLDAIVIGQDQAKLSLATAVYNHYLDVRAREISSERRAAFNPQHVLLFGPTGSGKSFLVRQLARQLGVPFVSVSAPQYSQTGYVGDKVESILAQLYVAAGEDLSRAQRGIVFIDEIDKIRRRDSHDGPDVSGEGVQVGLLALLDGRDVEFKTAGGGRHTLDVSRILFVGAGAFVNLPDIIRTRLHEQTPPCFGFACRGDSVDVAKATDAQLVSQYTTEDLERFGLIPELIGRFTTVSCLDDLTEPQLVQILRESSDSAIRQQVRLYGRHGIELEFDAEALAAIAARAKRLKTGARSLQRAVLRALDPIDWLPADLRDAGVVRITIGRATVEAEALPSMRRADGTVLSSAEFEAIKRAPARPTEDDAKSLRAGAFKLPAGSRRRKDTSTTEPRPSELTDTSSMRPRELAARVEKGREAIEVDALTDAQRKRWNALEASLGPQKTLRLIEEISRLSFKAGDFLDEATRRGTDSVRAALHGLGYRRTWKNTPAKR
jgi:ATP-dependent Clp protease ATP-binding subunit ClpX